MLLSFTAGNFRSIYAPQTLSMLADEEDHTLPGNVQTLADGTRVLKSAVIYGANSSGKTNLIHAIGVLMGLVRSNSKLDPGEVISLYDPFVLRDGSDLEPSRFEIELEHQGHSIRYGVSYTRMAIIREWLYYDDIPYIERNADAEQALYRPQGKDTLIPWDNDFALLNSNRLILSLGNQLLKHDVIAETFRAITTLGSVLSGLDTSALEAPFLLEILSGHDEDATEMKHRLNELFRRLNLGFGELTLKEQKTTDNYSRYELETTHTKYDREGNHLTALKFNKDQMESEGTKKIIELLPPLIKHLKDGALIIIDELDSKLHPLLTREIIRLFAQGNDTGAQLVFATHDSNLLSAKIFRADQIWFTEKSAAAETCLYSLVEFDEQERQQLLEKTSLETSYLQGRYGAIPIIR